MAKRQRLNKRAVAVLVVVGTVVLLGAAYGLRDRLFPRDPVTYLARADAAYEKGDYVEADRCYGIAAGLRSRDPFIIYKLAKVKLDLRRTGKMAETERNELLRAALGLLRQSARYALEANIPFAVEPERAVCNLFWDLGDARNFLTESDKLLQLDPNDAQAWFRRGIVRARMSLIDPVPNPDRVAEATGDMWEALRLKPDDLTYWGSLLDYHRRIGRDANVPGIYEEALAANPDAGPMRSDYAAYLREHGRSAQARQQIDQILAHDPNGTLGHIALAAYLGAGDANDRDLVGAMAELDEAARKDDTDFRIYQLRADLLGRQEKHQEAVQAVRQGIEIVAKKLNTELSADETRRLEYAVWRMNSFLGSLLLTRYLQAPGEMPNALEEAQKCLDAMPPDAPGRNRVAGLLAFAKGELMRSADLLQQALREGGGMDPVVTECLLRALMRLEQPTRAQKVLEDIGRLPGASAGGLLLTMAELKMNSRDFHGASLDLTRVLASSPPPAVAARAIALRYILDVLMGTRSQLPPSIPLTPTHVNLLLDRAMQLNYERHPEEALALIENLHQRAPANRQVIQLLLDIYVSRQQDDRIQALRKDAQADPALVKWIDEEVAIRHEGDPVKRFNLQLARLEKDNPDLQGAAKELYLARVAAQYRLADEAEKRMKAAADAEPNNPRVIEAYFLRAAAAKDWNTAEEWCRRAGQSNADNLDGRWYSARLAVYRQQYLQAIEYLKEVVRVRPEMKFAQVMLAECYYNNHEVEKAKQTCDAVLKTDASYFPALRIMALITEGDPADHAFWVEKASQQPDGEQDEYIQRQRVLQIEGSGDPNTLPVLIDKRQKLLQQNPRDLENAYQLAVLYDRSKHNADMEQKTDESKRMADLARQAYRYVFERSSVQSKLSAARPLASFYARSERLNDLIALLDELSKTQGVDPVGLKVLAGDTLADLEPNAARRAYEDAISLDANNATARFHLAQFYQRQGQWNEAIQAYERYQAVVPAERSANLWIAFSLIQANQYAQADKVLTRFLAADPTNSEALALVGVLGVKQGRYPEAEKAFDRSLQSDPGNLGALLGRSRLYLLMGRIDESRQDMEKAHSRLGTDPAVILDYAQMCQNLGDAASAEMAYRDILSRQKSHPLALLALAELYLNQKNWAPLEQRLADAKRLFPNEPAYLMVESRMWKARGEIGKSIEAMKAAVAAAPTVLPVRVEYLVRLLEEEQYGEVVKIADDCASRPFGYIPAMAAKGRALVRLGRTAEGEAAFLAALKSKPNFSQTVFLAQQMSRAYTSPTGARDAALRLLREANLTDPFSKFLVGMLCSEAKDFAAAVRWIEDAMAGALSPVDRASMAVQLGLTHYQNNDYQGAEKAYLSVLKVAPNDLQSLNNLAYLYVDNLQDANRAIPYARKALELAVGNANVVDTYGWVLVHLNKHDEGLAALQRATSIGGPTAVYRYHMGYVCEQESRLEDALKYYQEGLKLSSADDAQLQTTLQQSIERVRKKLNPEKNP